MNGIGLQFADNSAFYIGTRDGDLSQYGFDASTARFIGFYGYASDTAIETLGFLTLDVECSLNGGPVDNGGDNENNGGVTDD